MRMIICCHQPSKKMVDQWINEWMQYLYPLFHGAQLWCDLENKCFFLEMGFSIGVPKTKHVLGKVRYWHVSVALKWWLCGLCDQGNCEDTGSAAQSTADGLKQLVALSRGIAATMPAGSSISPNDILDAAGDILDKSANLIAAAKTAVDDPENPNSKAQLTQVDTQSCSSLFHTI